MFKLALVTHCIQERAFYVRRYREWPLQVTHEQRPRYPTSSELFLRQVSDGWSVVGGFWGANLQG